MKILILILNFLSVGAVIAQSSYDSGVEMFKKQKYDSCIYYLSPLRNSNSENLGLIYRYIGASYFEEENLPMAFENIKRSIEYDSSDYKSYRYLAHIYAKYENYQMSIKTLDKALTLSNNKDLLVDRALCKKEIGDLSSAIYDCEKALKIDSLDQEIYGVLGHLFQLKRDFSSAEYYLKKSISIGENSANNASMGEILENEKRYNEALTYYSNSLHFDSSERALILYSRARVYLKISEREKACRDLQESYSLGFSPSYDLIVKNCKE